MAASVQNNNRVSFTERRPSFNAAPPRNSVAGLQAGSKGKTTPPKANLGDSPSPRTQGSVSPKGLSARQILKRVILLMSPQARREAKIQKALVKAQDARATVQSLDQKLQEVKNKTQENCGVDLSNLKKACGSAQEGQMKADRLGQALTASLTQSKNGFKTLLDARKSKLEAVVDHAQDWGNFLDSAGGQLKKSPDYQQYQQDVQHLKRLVNILNSEAMKKADSNFRPGVAPEKELRELNHQLLNFDYKSLMSQIKPRIAALQRDVELLRGASVPGSFNLKELQDLKAQFSEHTAVLMNAYWECMDQNPELKSNTLNTEFLTPLFKSIHLPLKAVAYLEWNARKDNITEDLGTIVHSAWEAEKKSPTQIGLSLRSMEEAKAKKFQENLMSGLSAVYKSWTSANSAPDPFKKARQMGDLFSNLSNANGGLSLSGGFENKIQKGLEDLIQANQQPPETQGLKAENLPQVLEKLPQDLSQKYQSCSQHVTHSALPGAEGLQRQRDALHVSLQLNKDSGALDEKLKSLQGAQRNLQKAFYGELLVQHRALLEGSDGQLPLHQKVEEQEKEWQTIHKGRGKALGSLKESKQPLLEAYGIEDTHAARSQKKVEKMAIRLGINEAQNLPGDSKRTLADACDGYFTSRLPAGLGVNDLFSPLGLSDRALPELFAEAGSWAKKAQGY